LKIILSPSKTANYQKTEYLSSKSPLFSEQAERLRESIVQMNQTQLAKALHLTKSMEQSVYQLYHDESKQEGFQAFPSFNGLVFKQLNKSIYSKEQWHYIADHVRILDAMYGILEPGTLIRPYRLDMTANLKMNLYDFWDLDTLFQDETIINLASQEYSSMIKVPMITIQFLQNENGTYHNKATYSKMARGKMMQYLILNLIDSLEEIKQFSEDGYRFYESLSDDFVLTFVR